MDFERDIADFKFCLASDRVNLVSVEGFLRNVFSNLRTLLFIIVILKFYLIFLLKI